MSKAMRVGLWVVFGFILSFIVMPIVGQRYGLPGLIPLLAIALLMGISLFPHILQDK